MSSLNLGMYIVSTNLCHVPVVAQSLGPDGGLGLRVLDWNPDNPWKEVLHGGHGFAWEEVPIGIPGNVPPPLRSYLAAAGEAGWHSQKHH